MVSLFLDVVGVESIGYTTCIYSSVPHFDAMNLISSFILFAINKAIQESSDSILSISIHLFITSSY